MLGFINIYFRSFLSFLFVSILIYPVFASERELSISSETMLRFFEREKEGREKIKAIPAYEYLEIDYGTSGLTGFSFHADGWGRVDSGDRSFYEDDVDGYIMNGYIQYFNSSNGLDIKLGRQHIYSGVVNSSIDGFGLNGRIDRTDDKKVAEDRLLAQIQNNDITGVLRESDRSQTQ